MAESNTDSNSSTKVAEVQLATVLTRRYLQHFPEEAARELEKLSTVDAAELLMFHDAATLNIVWAHISPATTSLLLPMLKDETAVNILYGMDAVSCAGLLSQLEGDDQSHYLDLLNDSMRAELTELLEYPPNSAGRMMDSKTITMSYTVTVGDAMKQLRRYSAIMRRRIFTLDQDMCLHGQVDLERLVVAEPELSLQEISRPVTFLVAGLDRKEDVARMLQQNTIETLPVVDIHRRLLGVIRGTSAIETLKEDIASELQTMVGVSKDEQAQSGVLFAVRKRQSWLQINLLTGFLAAAVVGLFESTIGQFTALAVLMPIAAGQSGNTGAQALAVTMRGLTLREITTRNWFGMMSKEATTGFINGLAIALTCSLGVYLWSDNTGLSMVIALAMIISMTIAGISGALVPICLKKLGQDPAQSSSIILTTITDIAGFMSFLGIATLLTGLITKV